MVAKGAFGRGLAGMDPALKQDLGAGRGHQRHCATRGQFGARAAQHAGKAHLGHGFGQGQGGGQQQRGIGAKGDGHGHRLTRAGPRLKPCPGMRRAAAMGQPAHDQPVWPQNLRAIDAKVIARQIAGPAILRSGDDHWPGDQRAGIVGPGRLHRNAVKAGQLVFLHRAAAQDSGPCRHGRAQHRPAREGVAHARDRGGAAQGSQKRAEFRHLVGRQAQPRRDPGGGAEQVADHAHARPVMARKLQRRAAAPQAGQLHGGHFMADRDRLGDAGQLALRLAPAKIGAQIGKDRQASHRRLRSRPERGAEFAGKLAREIGQALELGQGRGR